MTDSTGNAPASPPASVLPVTVTPSTAALAGFTLLAVFGLWNTLVSGRSIIATAVAAFVVAMLMSGPIEALDKRMPRPIAILVALLLLGGAAGAVGYAAFDDLDAAFERLQVEAPQAAAELESSERFGEIATDLQLESRVTAAVDRLRSNAQDRAQATALRFVNYFVGGILAVFLLVYGPRIFDGMLRQIRDDERRERVSRIAYLAVEEARVYLGLEIVNAVVIGFAAFLCFRWLDLPGSAALALVVGLASVIPDVGIISGAMPAVLLTAASSSYERLLLLIGAVIVVQIIDSVFAHRQLVKTVDVGPAVSLLSVLLGFAIYGIGGALFGFALAVFVSSVIDAVGQENTGELVIDHKLHSLVVEPDDDSPPET